jgi:hypothetical protein
MAQVVRAHGAARSGAMVAALIAMAVPPASASAHPPNLFRPYYSSLADVDVSPSGLVWGVGTWANAISGPYRPLVLTWGPHPPRAMTVPVGTSIDDSLTGVAAPSDDDVWAVGYDNQVGMLAVHWDGVRWHRFDVPDPGGGISLIDVGAAASDDVWAVGEAFSTSYYGFIVHWDGHLWSLSQSLSPPNLLTRVDADSATDAWAVGYGSGRVALHWDGSTWTETEVPSPGGEVKLNDVDIVGPDDVWTAADYQMNSTQPAIYHWDGTEWTVSTIQLQGAGRMTGVSAWASDDVWIVGDNSQGLQAVHWNGTRWSKVPTNGVGYFFKVAASGPDMAWFAGQRGSTCGGGRVTACAYVVGHLTSP